MNAMRTKNYWDMPRFLIPLKISSDAKILYSLMLHMEKEDAIETSGISERRIKKVIQELEDEKLILAGKLQKEEEYLRNQKIVKVNFN